MSYALLNGIDIIKLGWPWRSVRAIAAKRCEI